MVYDARFGVARFGNTYFSRLTSVVIPDLEIFVTLKSAVPSTITLKEAVPNSILLKQGVGSLVLKGGSNG